MFSDCNVWYFDRYFNLIPTPINLKKKTHDIIKVDLRLIQISEFFWKWLFFEKVNVRVMGALMVEKVLCWKLGLYWCPKWDGMIRGPERGYATGASCWNCPIAGYGNAKFHWDFPTLVGTPCILFLGSLSLLLMMQILVVFVMTFKESLIKLS